MTEQVSKKKSKGRKKRKGTIKSESALQSSIIAAADYSRSSTLESVDIEKADVPKLNIDISKLFSMAGSRPNGSALHNNDIQNLLLYSVLGGGRWERPSWCTMGYPVRNDGTESYFIQPLESCLNYRMKKKTARQKQKDHEEKGVRPEELVLTKEQRIVNEYPVVDEVSGRLPTTGFVSMACSQVPGKATMDGNMFAIDCEMCKTVNGSELTRISIINENMQVVYDTYVKPDAHIVDYRTEFSGITPEILTSVRTRLCDVQQKFLEIISEKDILIGHSLQYDLHSLKIYHERCIDTAIIYGDQRGPRYTPSLKKLVKHHLHREIQNDKGGHCSIEDAKACMELVQLKVEKGKYYGTFDRPNESIFEAFSRAGKKSAVIDVARVATEHCFNLTHAVICKTDAEVVQGTKTNAGNVSFVYSHLKSFESFLRANDQSGTRPEIAKVKEAVKELDDNIGKIVESAARNSLVVVLFSSGFIPAHIQQLQRDKDRRRFNEVRMAVKSARDAICFIKVT
eukprot:gene9137-10110_t